jgi:hypothetical protein
MRPHDSNSTLPHILDRTSTTTRGKRQRRPGHPGLDQVSVPPTPSINIPRRRLRGHYNSMTSVPSPLSRPSSRGPATLLSLPPESLTQIAELLIGTQVPECLFNRDQAWRTARVYTSNKDPYPPADEESDDDHGVARAAVGQQQVRSNARIDDGLPPDLFISDHSLPNHFPPIDHVRPRRAAKASSSRSASHPYPSTISTRHNNGKRPVPDDSLLMRSVRSLAGE